MFKLETMKTVNVIGVLAVVLILAASPAAAQVIFVDDDAGPGGDGESWDTAFKYLQDAINLAPGKAEIHVADGTYRPDQGGSQTPGDRNSHFHLINGVTILGGYRGCPGGDCSGDPDARDIASFETILDGDLDGNDDPNEVGGTTYANNSRHVVVGSGNDSTAVLDGCTIRGGCANDGSGYPLYDDCGGGLRVSGGGAPTITACILKQNYANYGGGAGIRDNSDVSLTGCTFEHNRALGGGGAYFDQSTGQIADCWFAGNEAGDGAGLRVYSTSTPHIEGTTFYQNTGTGATTSNTSMPTFTSCDFIGNTSHGARVVGGQAIFSSCTFESNQSSSSGAGLVIDGGGATLTDCDITDNVATQSGGGMWLRTGDIELVNCTIEGNTAAAGAGMYIDYGGTTVTAVECEIVDNSTTGGGGADGGAIYIHGDVTASFQRCLIAGNSAYTGAGAYIYSWGSATNIPVSFANCLIAGNVANAEGGALYANRRIDLTLTNCTLVNNAGTAAHALYCTSPGPSYTSTVCMTNCIVRNGGDEILNEDGSAITIRHSDITGGWGNPNDYNIDTDPLFADEDGLDDDPDTWDDNDWRLQPGLSPCLDAGINAADTDIHDPNANPLPNTDYDGWPRFQDDTLVDDCPQGDCGEPPIVDMGAFEVWTDCNANGVADVCEVTANCDSLWPCDPNDCDAAIDCDDNDVPDECDIAVDHGLDCDGNGQIDDCEIAADSGLDCNGNGELDECDIASGYSWDFNDDGTPDECQPCAASAWDMLAAPLGAAGELLGSAVASDDDWLLIGSPNAEVSSFPVAGRVLVARHRGAHWTIEDELTAPAPAAGATFGAALAVRDNVAAVGAPGDGTSGEVYVYRLNAALGVWEYEETLHGAGHASASAGFGFSVDVDGDYLVAGAPAHDANGGALADAGLAVVFEYDPNAALWDAGTQLLPPDPGADDLAGYAVAVSDDAIPPYVVVGAPTEDGPGDAASDMGAVYRWEKVGGAWTLDSTTYRLDDGEQDDAFGVEVAAVGAEFFAGAPGHLNASLTRGVVAVFGPTPARVEAPVGDAASFGRLIDVHGERLAIAALLDPDPDSRVYLYERRAAGWTQLAHFGQELHQDWLPAARCLALGPDVLFVGDGVSDAACGSCGAAFAYGSLGDCNANDWIDLCEIASGAATDCNRTGTPDDCELIENFDFDADGDVDNDDFAALAAALAGPDLPPDPDDPTCVDTYLAPFDVEPDTDLDLYDFAAFQRAFSGPPTVLPPGMVLVPAGGFEMGDPWEEGFTDEVPVHNVYLDTYYIDTYEVKNQQYADALNWALAQGGLIEVTIGGVVRKAGATEEYCQTATSHPSSGIAWDGITFSVVDGMEARPMVLVSWYGSVAYCNWRSGVEGRAPCYDLAAWTCDFDADGFRLPTEAEWEKAAGWDPSASRHFRFGEHTDGCAWACLDGERANYTASGDPYEAAAFPYTTPVGFYNGELHYKVEFNWPGSATSYQTQNAQSYYGCYDMSGNVYEWCNDWYDDAYYDASPYEDPHGPASGTLRVLRGGEWNHSPDWCRSADRNRSSPGYLSSDRMGFRCALRTP